MKSIVFAVILAVVSNAVDGHHHHDHHKYEFDHHRPWDNNPDQDPDSQQSSDSSEYESNEWGDGNDNWWDTNRPSTQMKEPGLQECMEMCYLPTDYAPVCGTNNITYKNLDHLHCARQCGVAVSVRKLSKCTSSTPSTNDWTRTQSTNRETPTTGYDFWSRSSTKTPFINGNDFWTRSPSTKAINFWTRTPIRTPSTNSNDFWARLTSKTPSTTIGDFWTYRPPNRDIWTPSSNVNNGWTTPTPNNINDIESCIISCAKSTSKSPVCGTNNYIYNNLEHLHCAQLCGVDVSEQRLSKCPTGNNNGNETPVSSSTSTSTAPIQARTTISPILQTCIRSCPATSEYNPVCGTDGVTYNNLGQLWCAVQCGKNVGLHRQSPCPTTSTTQPPTGLTTQSLEVAACIRSCPVTSEFNPVCGTDGVTYSNNGRLECAKYCGVDVKVRRNSACPTTPIAFALETTTISMVPSSNQLDQNKRPEGLTPPANDDGIGFTIPADILASVFTEAPPTAAPEDDIDPRFDTNRNNNNTDNSSIKYIE